MDDQGSMLDCSIILAGPDSDIWVSITRKNQREALKRIMGGEASDDDNMQMVLDATLGWEGFTQDSKSLEFSKEAALILYQKAPYIVDQAILFINNRANFTES